jgi:hypothetical protein
MSLPEFKIPSEFRVWLQEKWFEHKDELIMWERKEPEYDDKYYFRKHKWMLRKMYREEKQRCST